MSVDETRYFTELGRKLDEVLTKSHSQGLSAKAIGLIALSLIAVLGAALVALLSFTNTDWFYPTLAFSAIVYVVWQRYL